VGAARSIDRARECSTKTEFVEKPHPERALGIGAGALRLGALLWGLRHIRKGS
jgi:hypothetical protein